jgi:hypothetical protein
MRNILMALCGALALSLPAAAKSVTCNDGTMSTAGRGACSHHGGVATAKAEKGEKPAKPDAKADKSESTSKDAKKADDDRGILGTLFGKKSNSAQGRGSTASPRSSTRENKAGTPTAKCKDGTTSYSAHHSGTCSGHGGVAEWLDK